MTPAHITANFSEMIMTLQSWVHSATPVGTQTFDGVAIFSLACYLLFAVIALHYALQPWAVKVMLISIAVATVASLWLHLAMRHSPAYVGEGSLWKFVSLSQHLPWAVIGVGGVYLLYRVGVSLLRRRN